MNETSGYLELLAQLFIFTVGLVILVLVILFLIDVTQRRHAIRRNFPVIGRFRDFFEYLPYGYNHAQ